MAKRKPSKRTSKKKTPARTKPPRGSAKAKARPTRKASTKSRKATRKKSAVKGKPKTASTRSHGGVSKPPKRSPAATTKRDVTTSAPPGRVVVENVNVPGYRSTVDAAKYEAMRGTLMGLLPRAPPGLTQGEMVDAAAAKAPADHFPGGDKVGWWVKCVQLDQEAKGNIRRSDTKPIRWWRN